MQRQCLTSFVCFLFIFTFQRMCTLVVSQSGVLDSPENLQIYRQLRLGAYNILGRTGTDARSLSIAKNANIVKKRISDDIPFPCDVKGWRSRVPPTSVHRLKPGDIDIIASMGDSLSAGTGIFGSNLLHLLIDNRGVTGAGGGQGSWREYITLPNILKEFNPNLYGYSTGDFSALEEGSKFNVAEITAESKDMPYMASILIKRLKNDPRVDMEKHWKLISLMIGPNDFCSEVCVHTSMELELLKNHEKDIVETLRILKNNVPRVLVSLIAPPSMSVLAFTREGRPSLYCDLLLDFECPCIFGPRYRNKRLEYYAFMEKWQWLDYKITRYPEFQKDDFAVVFQPVFMNFTFPVLDDGYADMTYLASDCFHVTQKMNADYGNTLWNSLLLPLSEKPINTIKNVDIACPTKKRPYLGTYLNEGMTEDSLYGV